MRLVERKGIVDARNGIYIEKQVFKRRGFRNDPALFIINVISRAGFAERKAPPVRLVAENPDLIIATARKRPAGPDMVYRAGAPKSIYLLQLRWGKDDHVLITIHFPEAYIKPV